VGGCRNTIYNNSDVSILVVNSVNSNSFTDKAVVATVKATAAAAAQAGNCRQKDVFIASTGVIGQPMDPEPVVKGIEAALASAAGDNWDEAARAIMTTDTYPKMATRKVKIGGTEVVINGIAKG